MLAVPTEIRIGYWVPWNQSYKQCGCWGPNPGPLQKQLVLLATKHLCSLHFNKCVCQVVVFTLKLLYRIRSSLLNSVFGALKNKKQKTLTSHGLTSTLPLLN